MIIKAYEKLPEEAHFIRQTVFVEEQGFKVTSKNHQLKP